MKNKQSLYLPEKLKEYRLKRDDSIIQLMKAGVTYEEIARLHGLTRQRIGQIVYKYRQQIEKAND